MQERKFSDEEVLEIVYPEVEGDCNYFSEYVYSANGSFASDKCPKCFMIGLESFKRGDNSYVVKKIGEEYFLNATVLVTLGRNTYRGDIEYFFKIDENGEILEKKVRPSKEQFACYN